ncbi:MAG: hypothetical protein QOF89_5063 [Acidobacteriota bacterium]|jgi:hypothetical protein|nr:hypothetical protein [Acidobacteriota bacterium]
MEFETLATPPQPVILTPVLDTAPEIERGTFRGPFSAPSSVAPLSGRFSAGGPIAAPIRRKDAAGDPVLLSFLTSQERTHRFHRLQLACTFDPDSDEPFAEATVQCVMRRVDGGPDVPTAWSMAPQRLEKLSAWKLTWNLKADVKFAEAGVGGEGTVGKPKPVIRAYNLLQSDPYWRLVEQPGERLYGSLELGMIVRAPRDVRVEITTTVSATVYRNKFGLVLHKTPLQPLTLPAVPID